MTAVVQLTGELAQTVKEHADVSHKGSIEKFIRALVERAVRPIESEENE